MVGLCASELTDGRLNLVSADCKQKQNKIVITDIQASQINEVFFYKCQINLDLWFARYVFFYIFMAFDNFQTDDNCKICHSCLLLTHICYNCIFLDANCRSGVQVRTQFLKKFFFSSNNEVGSCTIMPKLALIK